MQKAFPSVIHQTPGDRPVLAPVGHGFGRDRLTLYIGNLSAAEDAGMLQAAGVTASLNVALNVFPMPLALADGMHMRRYQIGLTDGPGNDPRVLAAAVLALHGLVETYTEGKPHYPPNRRGNILVHCRAGQSRSATVLALYLHICRPRDYPRLSDSLVHIRRCRGMDERYPLASMIALAEQALPMLAAISGRAEAR
ncbi:dual specificity protein phosphatase [Chelativorans sp. M5D2P16]|uniref:dual specificity protein phosphatase family protein n=1 Tax=Chelativorans sp. M5D2P16 TaxID=3095678 RepID=UPI002ACA1341|nr:dual specificity protein phosphatase [Chelativorans sp. M5D2P16]MDZ5695672.1 dual specificity protein phosphatase [Chelativorans sp. M5D2P16]